MQELFSPKTEKRAEIAVWYLPIDISANSHVHTQSALKLTFRSSSILSGGRVAASLHEHRGDTARELVQSNFPRHWMSTAFHGIKPRCNHI